MTDGRFESIYNLRPPAFENRPFWAESHKLQNAQSIKDAESCPYHDLRSGGRFMTEDGGNNGKDGGVHSMSPEKLTTRPAGSPLKTHLARSKNTGCGGALLLEDVDPLPNQSPIKRSAAPWTHTGMLKDSFSTPPYVSAPNRDKPKQQYEPPFHTGAAGSPLGRPYPFVAEQTERQSPPRAFRLKAGTYKAVALPPIRRGLTAAPELTDEAKKRKTNFRSRGVFRDKNTTFGTFGRTPEHVPTPYQDAPLGNSRGGTLFTYASKSKRDLPIQCPWDCSPNRVRAL